MKRRMVRPLAMTLGSPLPIDAVLEDVRRALAEGPFVVLVAPPGAGKTTRLPLALLGQHLVVVLSTGMVGLQEQITGRVGQAQAFDSPASAQAWANSLSPAATLRVSLAPRK